MNSRCPSRRTARCGRLGCPCRGPRTSRAVLLLTPRPPSGSLRLLRRHTPHGTRPASARHPHGTRPTSALHPPCIRPDVGEAQMSTLMSVVKVCCAHSTDFASSSTQHGLRFQHTARTSFCPAHSTDCVPSRTFSFRPAHSTGFFFSSSTQHGPVFSSSTQHGRRAFCNRT